MIWNYRVTHRPKTAPLEGYQIREVYYDEKGRVKFYTQNPVTPFGDLPDELYEDFCEMMKAFDVEAINLDHQDYLLRQKEKYK
jgi:hypothetical protein